MKSFSKFLEHNDHFLKEVEGVLSDLPLLSHLNESLEVPVLDTGKIM